MDYVSRAGWNAAPPKSDIPPFVDFRGLTVHHSDTPAPAMHDDCPKAVLGIQHYQMFVEGVYQDIAYSWVVCPHGTIFEGRGWAHHDGANGAPNSAGYSSPAGPGTDANYYYPAACVIGQSPEPTAGVAAALASIRQALLGLHPGATEVWPHSRVVPTACPGDALRAWIAAKGYEVQPAPSEADMLILKDTLHAQPGQNPALYVSFGDHGKLPLSYAAFQQLGATGVSLVVVEILHTGDPAYSLLAAPNLGSSAPAPAPTTVPKHSHPVSGTFQSTTGQNP